MNKIGSIWRKWDLHIHCPTTVFNNQFQGSDEIDKWKKYIEEIEKLKDFSVLGITDYFSIKGYKKMLELKNQGHFSNIDLLLPNVELRIIPVTGDSKAINLHIIFSPTIVDDIDSLFFNNLEFEYVDNTYKCIEADLINLGRVFKNDTTLNAKKAYETGCNQFKTSLKQLKSIFKKNRKLRENSIVAVSNNSTDGNSGIQHSSLAATRQEIYRFSEFIFSGNPNDRIYFSGNGVDNSKKVIHNYGSLKPCIHGSDAHKLIDICKPDKDRFTWIKSDPTFEGLRQIIYEPIERIKIQKENPQCDFVKPFFSEISIDKNIDIFNGQTISFEKQKIVLNPNLVSIIGGRGEGKSILIDYFSNGFGFSEKTNFNSSPNFKVNYSKGICNDDSIDYDFSERNNLDFLYISQNAVKNIALSHKKLGNEIRNLLKLNTIGFSSEIQESIDDTIKKNHSLVNWFDETNSNDVKINNRETLRSIKKRNEDLLNSITNKENQQKLKLYTENIKEIRLAEIKKERVNKVTSKLRAFELEITPELIDIKKDITLISFKTQTDELSKLINKLAIEIEKNNKENTKIKEEFSEIYKGDLTSLLESADKYKSQIETINEHLKVIEKQEKALLLNKKTKKEISTKLNEELNKQVEIINDAWDETIEGNTSWLTEQKDLMKQILSDREIEIKGKIYFDTELFHQGLKECINGKYWRNKNKEGELENHFNITDELSFFNFLKNNLENELLDNPMFYYEEDIEDYFYNLDKRQKYLYVQPEITYKTKTLDKISVGQRGTVYLCLKLATSAFSTPIIYDQPEDDLDNQFIINELVDIFKSIKKYRQVIIVTHNANLVINSDAEQIIIAKNTEEVLSYESGALENELIIKNVCDILEGGKYAFEQRKNRYKIE
tara:strand:- start:137 stop:2812 length:2676 start_codon:yes stop_codon:yes gene_type:complete